MENQNTQPAFPLYENEYNGGAPHLTCVDPGMTLFDYFAAKAMHAEALSYTDGLYDPEFHKAKAQYSSIAKRAYGLAAAMMEERKKYLNQ